MWNAERISRLASLTLTDRAADRTIQAKCELFDSSASVTDRLALPIVEVAERDQTLKPGQVDVDATSGKESVSIGE